MLRELDYVFKRTYVPKLSIEEFLTNLATHTDLVGDSPCEFWKTAYILNIQRNGNSQAEMRDLFNEILNKQCGLDIDDCGASGGASVYIDDAIFTGDRVTNDLTAVIEQVTPRMQLHIIAIATHSYAEYRFGQNNRIRPILSQKQISVQFWKAITFENRRSWHDQSAALIPTDVLRPGEIDVRNPTARAIRFFSGVEGRQLLEREFLSSGERIRAFANNPSPRIMPLGYSPFEPGFGSLFVTYRNCPNNCPLALWYGDPSTYAPNHPLGMWYPLFPRKTYSP